MVALLCFAWGRKIGWGTEWDRGFAGEARKVGGLSRCGPHGGVCAVVRGGQCEPPLSLSSRLLLLPRRMGGVGKPDFSSSRKRQVERYVCLAPLVRRDDNHSLFFF